VIKLKTDHMLLPFLWDHNLNQFVHIFNFTPAISKNW